MGWTNKGPIDMCSNMGSSKRPHRFGLDVIWMFFNVVCQKKNDIKLYWGEVLVRMQLETNNNKYGTG